MKRSLLLLLLPVFFLACAASATFLAAAPDSSTLRSVSSESELYSFYLGYPAYKDSLWFSILTLPFSPLYNFTRGLSWDFSELDMDVIDNDFSVDDMLNDGVEATGLDEFAIDKSTTIEKDYSTTNLQVENVDEADIFKTDGNYVYSLSGTDVVITDVSNHAAPRVLSKISGDLKTTPEELILSDDSLVVISSERLRSNSRYFDSRYSASGTAVAVYDISDREHPALKKSFTLLEPYETSRRIDNRVYILSSGSLKLADRNTVSRTYLEDGTEKELPLNTFQYFEGFTRSSLSLIASFDLANPEADVSVQPFLLNLKDAYVSESAIYLTDAYSCQSPSSKEYLRHLFSFKGAFGLSYVPSSCSSKRETTIYKFNLEASGTISFVASTSLPGAALSQYSFDEKDGHLRVVFEDSGDYAEVWSLRSGAKNGSYVAVLDENLNLLGKSPYFGVDESLRASRFIGDKAYVVTYYNTDPLFVVDLSDETNPTLLGELKIPGYSTYLHPYDATHLLGIGVDTEETVVRNSTTSRAVQTTTRITGLKIALFDISDLENPRELSMIHLGNSRTTSAILTNPKALLFSKEKSLLAIPIQNFSEDISLSISNSASNADIESAFSRLSSKATGDGYLVLNLDLETGFTERGMVTHDASRLLRGAYIESDLMTVSENYLKFNTLTDLSPLSSLTLSSPSNSQSSSSTNQ
ncbi:beta-propeller domain-containing protein [Candidatus Saccharibacteria bacterium]|nr:beta-propeller domain-containing protein [Candidatus Saccharibacteria bacterium]